MGIKKAEGVFTYPQMRESKPLHTNRKHPPPIAGSIRLFSCVLDNFDFSFAQKPAKRFFYLKCKYMSRYDRTKIVNY